MARRPPKEAKSKSFLLAGEAEYRDIIKSARPPIIMPVAPLMIGNF
jgi:hypothetical protein